MRALRLLFALVTVIPMACTPSGLPLNSAETNISQSLLKPGEELIFRNRNGSVVVRWKDEFARTYIVDGVAYTVRLIGRPKEFRGQNGIYSPAAAYSKSDDRRHPHRRLVVEESKIDFENVSLMEAFLKEGRDYYAWVANTDGYVAGFTENPQRDQINVSLFRFSIKGKPVRKIPVRYLDRGSVTSPREIIPTEPNNKPDRAGARV